MDSLHVLVIDDEPGIRRLAELSLAHVGGMRVSLAARAVEGLRLAETIAPDVILLDMMMPGMSGLQALAALRQNPATQHLPVVFLTAQAQPDDEREYLAMGATGVIAKPFDPMTLALQIKQLIASPSPSSRGVPAAD